MPIGVQRAQQRLRDEMEANPLRFFAQALVDRIAHTRRHLAAFLGADPDGTALVGNTTTGVAVALQSLGLRPDDEVLSTDHGYGAVSSPSHRECRRTGAAHRSLHLPLAATDEQLVQIIRAGLRPGRTRLLVVDQLTSATARALAGRRASLAVAARTRRCRCWWTPRTCPGCCRSTVDGIGADFWVGNLHKWAYAPRGTAVLAVAPRWRDRIEPLVVSWQQESASRRRRVAGHPRLHALAGRPGRPFTLRSLGVDRVRAHNAALAAYGQRVVGDALGVPPADLPDPGGPGVAMRIVPLPPGVAGTLEGAGALRARIADRLAAEVSVMAWNGRGWLRLCGQVYNTPDEYDRLATRLPALLAEG